MVTQEIIEECTTLLFLAWLGEKIAGAKLFKKYAKESPFLHEKLHNYFLGMYLDQTGIFGIKSRNSYSSLNSYHSTLYLQFI